MAPKFGTSGLRGLVVDLTDALVTDHVRAFLATCDTGAALYLGRDLRDSSPHLAAVVARAAQDAGQGVVDCGAVPTPALALAALRGGGGAVMVTGSHIPADRNGLKFYTVQGEITKPDETAILGALGAQGGGHPATGAAAKTADGVTADGVTAAGAAAGRAETETLARFHARYRDGFGAAPGPESGPETGPGAGTRAGAKAGALAGARVGVYSHSSVGRDLLIALLRDLGAEVTEFGRAAGFVPVDTEAVDAATRDRLCAWAAAAAAAGAPLDAIVSTDGDADRPLLTDAAGEVVPGDVLGQITAQLLGAEVVVTPVSSNTGADLGGHFEVVRTRIGSPFVIAGMARQAGRRVVGYEANGGFLLGFDARGPAGPLAALPTRDCVLPLLATLVAARTGEGRGATFDIAARVAAEPPRFTAADRLEGIPTETSAAFLAGLGATATRTGLLTGLGLGADHRTDTTDGLRMTDAAGTVLHLRPSGNAPEFRVYAEAESRAAAAALLARALDAIGTALRRPA